MKAGTPAQLIAEARAALDRIEQQLTASNGGQAQAASQTLQRCAYSLLNHSRKVQS